MSRACRIRGQAASARSRLLLEAGSVTITTAALLIVDATTLGRGHGYRVAAAVCVLTFCLIYRVPRGPRASAEGSYRQLLGGVLHLAQSLLVAGVAGDVVLALLGHDWTAILVVTSIWFASSFAAAMVARCVGTYASAHPSFSRRIARNVAVIGDGGDALHVADLCLNFMGETIRLVGVFSDTPGGLAATVAGSINDLIELTGQAAVDDVIIAVPRGVEALKIVSEIRWRLRGTAVAIYVLPHLAQPAEVALPVEMMGPLALKIVQFRPLTFHQEFWKRLLDVTLALILITILAPLFAAIALAVKLDSPGPVLFRQPRIGRNYQSFTVLKFRSMYAESSDMMATRQTSRSDPRVTRVGKWLRKLSLDELPQILNVVAGDMSLVGPRPHTAHTRAGGRLLGDAMDEYVIRHQVKPGITGWAQVNGARGELVTLDDLYRRVTYDLEYIERWSIWFDIRIIMMTVLREVFSKHAF
ncbi:MAG: exopolysaccharide biosynthesis polyprenyl glycosylphosphotransferase [Proteobacteria bacterium]|nr:exopolysaccharide biosynthesis polyprenyl glycosylphosphotransferase [Pseudomonadota bacterium]